MQTFIQRTLVAVLLGVDLFESQSNHIFDFNPPRRHDAEDWASPVDDCVFDGAKTITAVGERCCEYGVEVHAGKLET